MKLKIMAAAAGLAAGVLVPSISPITFFSRYKLLVFCY
jgi:hypothetical protein